MNQAVYIENNADIIREDFFLMKKKTQSSFRLQNTKNTTHSMIPVISLEL